MDHKIVDKLFFFCVILCSQFFIQHGKVLSSYLFNKGVLFYNNHYLSIEIILINVIAVILIIILRNKEMKLINKIFVSCFICAIGASLPIVLINHPSMLILMLQIYFYAVVIIILGLEPLLSKKMYKEFWKMLFEYMTKLIRYFLVIYVALIAVLKFISDGNSESKMGFMTTLFYPTVIVLISFFMIGYWVMLPVWNKIIDAYSENDNIIDRIKSKKSNSNV